MLPYGSTGLNSRRHHQGITHLFGLSQSRVAHTHTHTLSPLPSSPPHPQLPTPTAFITDGNCSNTVCLFANPSNSLTSPHWSPLQRIGG